MLFSVLLASMLNQQVAPASRGLLRTSEINALAKKSRSFIPKDEFDEVPAQGSVSGQQFILEVPPWAGNAPPVACFGYPMWSYESISRILYVSTGAHDFVLNTLSSKQGTLSKSSAPHVGGETVQYFASDCARQDLRPYTATNVYGADYRIEPTLQIITAVADALPRGLEWPSSFKIQTSGEQARALVPNLRVRFAGTLSDWKPGVSVACGSRRDRPTAALPYDRKFDICLFNGKIERIELLDVRTGKVIKTFTRPK
jgi:hypothetical protein